jgi:hypothetical protein
MNACPYKSAFTNNWGYKIMLKMANHSLKLFSSHEIIPVLILCANAKTQEI